MKRFLFIAFAGLLLASACATTDAETRQLERTSEELGSVRISDRGPFRFEVETRDRLEGIRSDLPEGFGEAAVNAAFVAAAIETRNRGYDRFRYTVSSNLETRRANAQGDILNPTAVVVLDIHVGDQPGGRGATIAVAEVLGG